MSFLRELQRRNVGRVATAYVVSAWLIVQVVETIFPAFGFSDRAFQTVVIVLAVGFIPTVIVAWLFQWTPEGLKRDDEAELSADVRLVRARNFDRGIIVVLLLAVSYFAVDKFLLPGTDVDDGFFGTRSIAVMPFEVRSSDTEQQHFANGVTDEIRYLLGTIRDLRVIAEHSSSLFRENNIGIAEIRDQFRVGHLLEGSLRMDGDRVRLSARLIETATETQLWSDVYEREIGDVFRIQDDIAKNVLHNLKIELQKPLRRSRNVDPEAHALVQRAKSLYEVGDRDAGERMKVLLEQALALDPEYVPALEWMGVSDKLQYDALKISDEEMKERWQGYREQIAQLDPSNAMLDYSDAWDLWEAGEWESAAEMYLRAMGKDLTSWVYGAAMFARSMGKLEVSRRLFEHAAAVDPLCYQCLRALSRAQMYLGDSETAIQTRRRFMTLAVGGELDYSMMLTLTGQPEKVADALAPMRDDSHQKLAMLAVAAHSMGDHEAVLQHLRRLEDLLAEAKESGDPFRASIQHDLASVYAWTGDADRAFELLMPLATKEGFSDIRMLLFHPVWREIRDDPRWSDLRAALDMTAERFAAIEFDPWLPE